MRFKIELTILVAWCTLFFMSLFLCSYECGAWMGYWLATFWSSVGFISIYIIWRPKDTD